MDVSKEHKEGCGGRSFMAYKINQTGVSRVRAFTRRFPSHVKMKEES